MPFIVPGNLHRSSFVEFFLDARFDYENTIERRSPQSAQSQTFIDLSEVPPNLFSKRLSLLLNTFYGQQLASNLGVKMSTLAYYDNATFPVRDLDTFSAKSPGRLARTDDDLGQFYHNVSDTIVDAMVGGLPFIPAATTATTIVHTPVYDCQWRWLATLLLAAGALLATGAALLAMQLRCSLAPDMLRYVASMTYANPFFRTPPGGTALDGAERAKLLRDVRVRIGDIRANDDDGDDDDALNHGGDDSVGEIAFVAADDVATCRLKRNRLYI